MNELTRISIEELYQVSGGEDMSPPPTKEPMDPDPAPGGGVAGWGSIRYTLRHGPPEVEPAD